MNWLRERREDRKGVESLWQDLKAHNHPLTCKPKAERSANRIGNTNSLEKHITLAVNAATCT